MCLNAFIVTLMYIISVTETEREADGGIEKTATRRPFSVYNQG